MFTVWPPYASSLPKVRLCFKVRELCSSLGVVTHSFCLTNICSKPLASSWSTFFSFSSVFGLHDRSFNLSVADEESALAMVTVDTVFCPDLESCFGSGIHIRQIQISEFGVQVSFPNQFNPVQFNYSGFGVLLIIIYIFIIITCVFIFYLYFTFYFYYMCLLYIIRCLIIYII